MRVLILGATGTPLAVRWRTRWSHIPGSRRGQRVLGDGVVHAWPDPETSPLYRGARRSRRRRGACWRAGGALDRDRQAAHPRVPAGAGHRRGGAAALKELPPERTHLAVGHQATTGRAVTLRSADERPFARRRLPRRGWFRLGAGGVLRRALDAGVRTRTAVVSGGGALAECYRVLQAELRPLDPPGRRDWRADALP